MHIRIGHVARTLKNTALNCLVQSPRAFICQKSLIKRPVTFRMAIFVHRSVLLTNWDDLRAVFLGSGYMTHPSVQCTLDILLFLKMLRTAVLAVRNTPLHNVKSALICRKFSPWWLYKAIAIKWGDLGRAGNFGRCLLGTYWGTPDGWHTLTQANTNTFQYCALLAVKW